MKAPLTPAGRLIVALDFKPEHTYEIEKTVLDFVERISGTGIVLKINSALRACGYSLAFKLKRLGFPVFADLKLCDIPETLTTDACLMNGFTAPDIVTVMAVAGSKATSTLVKAMPETEVLAVTVLTSMEDDECASIHGNGTRLSAGRLAEIAIEAGAHGLICSGHEATMLRQSHGDKITLNCPGIRPSWVEVKNDDQRRMMTPLEAIRAGATRIVVGRPITQAPDPLEAVKRIIGEIEEALAS